MRTQQSQDQVAAKAVNVVIAPGPILNALEDYRSRQKHRVRRRDAVAELLAAALGLRPLPTEDVKPT